MKSFTRTIFLILITILLQAFAFPGMVHAQGIVYGDNVPAGTVVDRDILLIGQNVSIAGTVNGNVIILGNQVTIDGTVNGSLILVGQNAAIAGTIRGGAYALVLTLELSPGAVLERDLYVTTVSLESGRDSMIQRDLLAISLDAGLGGRVGRDHYTAIGPIQLYNGLMRLLGFEELTLRLRFAPPQPALIPTLTPLPTLPAPNSPQGQPTNTPTSLGNPGIYLTRVGFPSNSIPEELQIIATAKAESFDWNRWAIDATRSWLVLSLFGLLALWMAPRMLEISGEPLRAHPWRTTAKGLLILVIAVNLFGVAILLAALIFSIGLALNFAGLWQLALALWVASYSLLALVLTVLWFLIVYGTKIIAVYLFFNWLFHKLSPSTWLRVVAILAGMLIYVLLRSVPYVGWVFTVLVSAAGMGSAWLAYRTIKQVSPPPIPPKSTATRKSRRSI